MRIKKRFLGFLVMIIFLAGLGEATLGISPSKVEIDFKPNLEKSINFKVLSDSKEKLEIYASGDLAKYVEFDKKEMVGDGSFIVTLNLPEKIEVPGKHRILVGVRETLDKEIAGVGVKVAVQSPIYVFVPYPGRYAEITLRAENVNLGEPVNFKLDIINRGKEDLDVIPEIGIFSEDEKLETLYFQRRLIKSQEEIKLHKVLDTTNYSAGDYKAIAILDYGDVAKAEAEFSLGTLFVKILEHTEKILIDGIQKFEIGVASRWNNEIYNVYANISILDGSEIVSSFKTSPADLEPWQSQILVGFLDSSEIKPGNYKANITLFYHGKTSGKLVDVKFVKYTKLVWILAIIGVAFVLIVLAVFLIKKYFKSKKK